MTILYCFYLKGRLTFEDGSFYDGMWRSGRRCGLGTFCYGNGDVFQGSWRDDVMHGKVFLLWLSFPVFKFIGLFTLLGVVVFPLGGPLVCKFLEREGQR